MIYKTISAKAIIADAERNFRLTGSSWIGDAIECIGEGLNLLNTIPQLVATEKCIKVSEGKAKLPCDLEQLRGVTLIDGSWIIPMERSSRFYKKNEIFGADNKYFLNPDYIHCPFTDGEIKVYYYAIGMDEEGYPLVPDMAHVRIALRWYILMMYLSRGNTHPMFRYEDAMQQWEVYAHRAKNRMNAMDRDEQERFRKAWHNFYPIFKQKVMEDTTRPEDMLNINNLEIV